jgi:hypothetical protein
MIMQRLLCLTILSLLIGTAPAWPQERNRRPLTPSGKIQIPSERTLEREVVTTPRNEFSRDDATAIEQMDQRDKQIDRAVEKGICAGC